MVLFLMRPMLDLLLLEINKMKIMYSCPSDNSLFIVHGLPFQEVIGHLSDLNKEELIEHFQREVDIATEFLNHPEVHVHFLKRKKELLDFVIRSKFTSFANITDELKNQLYRKIIWATVPDDAVKPVELPLNTDFETHREFRGAWKAHKTEIRIDIDLNKAKEIRLENIRSKRNSLLNYHDKLLARAIDLDDIPQQQNLRTKKQELRDATLSLKNLKPKSIEDIIAASPNLNFYE